ncbi:PilZ domain-containing protein [Candidatus Omnitrophota bacterium]
MEERRKFVRIPEQSEISYKILPNPKTTAFTTSDIGQGGIRFFVSEHIPKDSIIQIRLTIKNIPFSFTAVVKTRWVKKASHADRYEVGVEFVNIPNEASNYLISYIKKIIVKSRS